MLHRLRTLVSDASKDLGDRLVKLENLGHIDTILSLSCLSTGLETYHIINIK